MSESTVAHVLSIYKAARSDNERFAALMLVVKAVKSKECSAETRHLIFESIGFSFVNRLLRTDTVPEGCDAGVYKSLALTVLACFSTDEPLLTHPKMLAHIPLLNKLILSFSVSERRHGDDDLSMIEDCFQCLMAIASTDLGRVNMIERNSVDSLCQAVIANKQGSDQAKQLILILAHYCGESVWANNVSSLKSLLTHLSVNFLQDMEATKFETCETISHILSSVKKGYLVFEDTDTHKQWCINIHKALSEILTSKIGKDQREPALRLSSLMVDVLGVPWAWTTTEQERKFLLVLVHLSCIEIRMTLETLTLPEVTHKLGILIGCYSLVENVINHMTSGEMLSSDDKHILQIHTALTGALSAVLYLLTQLSQLQDTTEYKSLLYASVRVLGSWIAEDTSALNEQVLAILPFLIAVCKRNLEETQTLAASDTTQESCDIIRFLLPGFCHLTADKKAIEVLFQNKAHILLGQYLDFHWRLFSSSNQDNHESEAPLISVCGIFMNAVVMNPYETQNHLVFREILQLLMSVVHTLDYKSRLCLIANMSVLGLMILRQLSSTQKPSQSDTSEFFSGVVKFLSGAHTCVECEGTTEGPMMVLAAEYQQVWDDISQLWPLAMQVFCSCMDLYPYTKMIVLKSGWILKCLKTLQQSLPEIADDIKTAYDTFLAEMSKDEMGFTIIHDNSGKEIAMKQKLTSMYEALNR